jgi:hypothetical protein
MPIINFAVGGVVRAFHYRQSKIHVFWIVYAFTYEPILSLLTHVKSVGQRFAESRGFSPGAPVSSHRES